MLVACGFVHLQGAVRRRAFCLPCLGEMFESSFADLLSTLVFSIGKKLME